ncbi:VWA domain-containing protein [Saccharibacillus sp. CPCC 101409]|uniref:VWA domain-containing protein n=1 Tax=Saccharibacillus sp. CPCC 101409 TaxID=3058041 RepID=UPI002670E88D|nr:VWA domain-containing protein [Saccharibacillus sp. CPCC 101409]MDO3410800.1 VWA domain-containing protein [Saccharibacillus sp. CPCC 101409]
MGAGAEVLIQGANTQLGSSGKARVTVEWNGSPCPVDVSCFILGPAGKVPSDDYFIFYNQPSAPNGEVALIESGERKAVFEADLSAAKTGGLEKFVFAAVLDGSGTFAGVRDCSLSVECAGRKVRFEASSAGEEAALVLAEIYAYKETVKLRAVGRGFDGGLAPLAESFGVDVAAEEESPAVVETAPEERRSAPAPAEEETPPKAAAPSAAPAGRIDLLKRKVAVSLEKKQLAGQKAKVAVVFDASGSMNKLYKNGTVQRAFERILAVASSLDDDGVLDVWMFALEFVRARPATVQDYEGYVQRVYPFKGAGGRNNEPAVMRNVIDKFTVEEADPSMPVYIVFFSDGGVSETRKISQLLVESSLHPLFWQFVGLGKANYGVLRKLDDLPGRLVDNAGFFALDDIDSVSDEELYDRLFSEFPDWLREARAKNILRD